MGALTTLVEMARYTNRGFPLLGFCSTGGEDKYSFNAWKDCSQASSHTNFCAFFMSLSIDWILSANLGIKCDNAVSLPTNLCISLMLAGLLMLTTAWHLSGLASIPLWVNMKPRNFPPATPKTHFSGFSLMSYFRTTAKISSKSLTCCSSESDMTTMSSSVWSGTSRPSKGKLAGIIPVQVGASPHVGPTMRAWIQRNAGSPISAVAVYFPALLAEYIPTQGVAGGTCGIEGQHAIKPQKRRS